MAVLSKTHPVDELDTPFTPEAVEIMVDALQDVCAVLGIPEDRSVERDIVAARIIDLARTGVIDAHALRDRVLAEARQGL